MSWGWAVFLVAHTALWWSIGYGHGKGRLWPVGMCWDGRPKHSSDGVREEP